MWKGRVLKITTLILIALLLISLPSLISKAANAIDNNFTGNTTSYDLSATWAQVETANLSIATDTGKTIVTASVQGQTNYTGAKLYARIVRDGTAIAVYNLTSQPSQQTYSFSVGATETAGTHYYALESYCTAGRKCTIYQWNLTVSYTKPGAYSGGGGGNVSGVTGAPAGVLDCTGTDEITCTITPSAANFANNTVAGNLLTWNSTYNGTYHGYAALITNLQVNDTNNLTIYAINSSANLFNLNANNLTSGIVPVARVDDNLKWGNPGFSWTNGSNVLWINTRLDYRMGYNGTYKTIDLKSQQTGSINVTAYNATDDAYICSATIVTSTTGSTTCTDYTFFKGQWIYYKIVSITDIKDISVSPTVIRT